MKSILIISIPLNEYSKENLCVSPALKSKNRVLSGPRSLPHAPSRCYAIPQGNQHLHFPHHTLALPALNST